MLLIVILNLVLAVMIVSAMVALHTKAIFGARDEQAPQLARERSPRMLAPEYRPPRQRATRTARQPVTSSG